MLFFIGPFAELNNIYFHDVIAHLPGLSIARLGKEYSGHPFMLCAVPVRTVNEAKSPLDL
jgi:hypothetical protein